MAGERKVGLRYGVIGILDLMREPRAGVAPPLCNFDPEGFSLDLGAVGVSSTSRRNWVLFMTRSRAMPGSVIYSMMADCLS